MAELTCTGCGSPGLGRSLVEHVMKCHICGWIGKNHVRPILTLTPKEPPVKTYDPSTHIALTMEEYEALRERGSTPHHPASVAREEPLGVRDLRQRARMYIAPTYDVQVLDHITTLTADNAALRAEVERRCETRKSLEADVLRIIPADWHPERGREWGAHLGNILAEYVSDVQSDRDTLRAMVERVQALPQYGLNGFDRMERDPDGGWIPYESLLAALTPPTTEHTV